MRRPRIKSDGAGYYHCMPRIIERRMILGEQEKEKLLKLMHNLAAFGGLDKFVAQIFKHYPGHFGPKRKQGARNMRFVDWLGLCTLRDLRIAPVSRA